MPVPGTTPGTTDERDFLVSVAKRRRNDTTRQKFWFCFARPLVRRTLKRYDHRRSLSSTILQFALASPRRNFLA